MQALVTLGMEMRKLAPDQERLRRANCRRLTQHLRSGAQNRDPARLLADLGEGKHALGELTPERRIGGLLIELLLRVANQDPQPQPSTGFGRAVLTATPSTPPRLAQTRPTPPAIAQRDAVRDLARVTDGIRTRDHRDHNPGLYQLSYGHRALQR